MDLNLGDTQMIIAHARTMGVLRNQLAYLLASAYWETNRTMQPVEEAYYLANRVRDLDAWRRKNLRYYPWHGRGYVQTTWERNYRRLKQATGVDVISDPSLAMRPDVAAIALVNGTMEGWWTGKKISDYITLTRSDYVGARRTINGTDEAHAIAELARSYEAALLSEGYGVDQKPAPVINTKRDGTEPRTKAHQSNTVRAVWTGAFATVAGMLDQAKALVGQVSEALGVSPEMALGLIVIGSLAYVHRERVRKLVAGDDV